MTSLSKRFKGWLRGRVLSMDQMTEKAGMEYLARYGMLGERLAAILVMDDEDFVQWSKEWCQAALPYLRMRGDSDMFGRVLAFLGNFEEVYFPLKLRIDEYRDKGKDGKGKGQISNKCDPELKRSYEVIEFRMVTDAKILLGLSFSNKDTEPNTLVINKPEIYTRGKAPGRAPEGDEMLSQRVRELERQAREASRQE